MQRVVVGLDVGGTFTDVCAWDGRRLIRAKVPTTPDDYCRGVRAGLAALNVQSGFQLVAGSTIATNALLERRGARVAFVSTAGFRDLLAIGRQNRPDLYALNVRKPTPLVDPDGCFELHERLDADGCVLTPLVDADIDSVIAQIRRREITEVAVCLLFSFLDPRHEQQFAQRAEASGLTVSCSTRISPEFREFERASTTVINAAVAPPTAEYLRRLAAAASETRAADVRVMLSNGGQTSTDVASREPVRTILSGPAGGALAAAHAARRLGLDRVLTFDMGGTSTDVALCDGEIERTAETVIDGWPIRVPMLAIHTVGQGGGSIAALDAGGALQVGPQSAGANPGPACYGRGDLPTVTDANLVLGRIAADRFLGGRMPLDASRSRSAVERIARNLNGTIEAAASAVIAVANAGMERALHVVSSRRGHDPADFWLVSFGGAGGLHAAALADALNMRGVIIPIDPGILSATGMILADVVRDFSASLSRGTTSADTRRLQQTFAKLMDQAADAIFRDGYDLDDAVCDRFVDLRYAGQGYELTVPVESLTDPARLAEPFHRLHKQRYGLSDEQLPVEIVTARVRSTVQSPKYEPPPLPDAAGRPAPLLYESSVWFERPYPTPHYDRNQLLADHELNGPALILEDHATTLLPPGWRACVEPTGDLRLTRNPTAAIQAS